MDRAASPEGDERDLLGTLYLLLGIVFSVWMMWELMIPQDRKTRMRMSLLRSCHRVTSELGRRTAVLSMGRELRTGRRDYRAPYAWAMRGERLLEAYERERGGVA